MSTSWYAVRRGITKHPIFYKKPERLAVWMWLLDNACWRDTEYDIKGKTITVKRGQICASERHISEECGVGYQVVRTLFKRLKDEHMINAEVTHGKNVVTLCNYEKYQDPTNSANAANNATVTRDQRTKEQGNKPTLPTEGAPAAPPPVDPVKVLIDSGIAILGAAGVKDRNARSLIGKWRKALGDEGLIAALGACQREGAVDPTGFVERIIRNKGDAAKHVGVQADGAVRYGGIRMPKKHPRPLEATPC